MLDISQSSCACISFWSRILSSKRIYLIMWCINLWRISSFCSPKYKRPKNRSVASIIPLSKDNEYFFAGAMAESNQTLCIVLEIYSKCQCSLSPRISHWICRIQRERRWVVPAVDLHLLENNEYSWKSDTNEYIQRLYTKLFSISYMKWQFDVCWRLSGCWFNYKTLMLIGSANSRSGIEPDYRYVVNTYACGL